MTPRCPQPLWDCEARGNREAGNGTRFQARPRGPDLDAGSRRTARRTCLTGTVPALAGEKPCPSAYSGQNVCVAPLVQSFQGAVLTATAGRVGGGPRAFKSPRESTGEVDAGRGRRRWPRPPGRSFPGATVEAAEQALLGRCRLSDETCFVFSGLLDPSELEQDKRARASLRDSWDVEEGKDGLEFPCAKRRGGVVGPVERIPAAQGLLPSPGRGCA